MSSIYPMPESLRLEKINELIYRQVSQAICQEVDIANNVLITVSQVVTSEDLKQAKVIISVFPFSAAQAVFKQLQKQIYSLQQILNHNLKMHPVPKIIFVLDQSQEKQAKIEKIIKKIKK